MKFARVLLRVLVGGLFVGHGTQKLFGWFGGHGPDATGQMFEGIGMRPGRRNALAAGAAEAGGGAALALGAATPLAASALIATMLTAINRVHLKNGVWATNGGYEYNLVLIAAVLGLAELGPGTPSVDNALGIERSGPRWALAALAAGVTGAVGAHLAAEAHAPAPTPPEAAPATASAAATASATQAEADAAAVAETQPA